jgi:uncharacterized protein YraI
MRASASVAWAQINAGVAALMPKIIISYRRADTQDITMRIRDRLATRYGKGSVFTDIDSIPIGSDFLKYLNNELSNCDALLAIVGQQWLRSGHGLGPGIEEETDYVRLEVEGALKRDIPVVPVIVSGARMPKAAELPESMRTFVYRNAATVDSGINFQNDMDRLVRALDEHFAPKATGQPVRTQGAVEGKPDETQPNQLQNPVAANGRWASWGDEVTKYKFLRRAVAALNTARNSVPAVDFAIGTAGIACLAALALGFLGYARASAIIFGGMLVALAFIVICARLMAGGNSALTVAGVVTVWAAAMFFIIFLCFTASAVAFKWPQPWALILGFDVGSEKASICSAPDEEVVNYSCGHAGGDYVVINIRSDDADHGLVIRNAADISGIQIGVIPPNGTDIVVGQCEADWCPVQCKGVSGWSRKRYLSARTATLRSVTGINPNDPVGLSVRSGPLPTCRSVGALPYNGREVILHGCERSPSDQPWCRITYNRISGWVPQASLDLSK